MKVVRVLTLSTAVMVMLAPGLLRAAEAQRSFDSAQLHEQVRIMAEAATAENRDATDLTERKQRRLNWDADNSVQAASANRMRLQEQHRVQARQRLEKRLNSDTQPRYGSAAYSDSARSWSADQRFGQGYEARMMSRGQGSAAAGSGRSAGGRR